MSLAPAARPTSGTGTPASVVVIDDSAVVRGLFSRWLGEHPGFQVVATAGDGQSGLQAVLRTRPDIVLLDLEMPVMDGLTVLPKLIEASPGSAIVVVSGLTARSARLSLQCLQLGATDLQPKPASMRDFTLSLSFREEFMRKLVGLSRAGTPRGWRNRPRLPAPGRLGPAPAGRGETSGSAAPVVLPLPLPAAAAPPRAPLELDVRPRALLIGASTGGPRAIAEMLTACREAVARVPVLICQHMPPVFTATFAEQLGLLTGLPAREAQADEKPQPGHLHIAPGGRHLRLVREAGEIRMRLDDGPPVKFCRPSVDVLFCDAAQVYGASALAVILTGMGSDGSDGAALLAQSGAGVIAQDEASSVVWGMPGSVVRAGIAGAVLPIGEIGPLVADLLTTGGRR